MFTTRHANLNDVLSQVKAQSKVMVANVGGTAKLALKGYNGAFSVQSKFRRRCRSTATYRAILVRMHCRA